MSTADLNGLEVIEVGGKVSFWVSNLLQEEAPASQDFGQGPPSARRTEQCLVSRLFFLSFLDINLMSLIAAHLGSLR